MSKVLTDSKRLLRILDGIQQTEKEHGIDKNFNEALEDCVEPLQDFSRLAQKLDQEFKASSKTNKYLKGISSVWKEDISDLKAKPAEAKHNLVIAQNVSQA